MVFFFSKKTSLFQSYDIDKMRNIEIGKRFNFPYRTLAGNFESKPGTKIFSYCFRDSDHRLLIFFQKIIPFVGSVIFVVLLGKPRELLPLLLDLVLHLGLKGRRPVKLPSLSLCISSNKDPQLGKCELLVGENKVSSPSLV